MGQKGRNVPVKFTIVYVQFLACLRVSFKTFNTGDTGQIGYIDRGSIVLDATLTVIR
jgi:hypothetical protein